MKTIESTDGKKRMSIVKSTAGNLFRFEEETFLTDREGYKGWDCTYISGFYDSAEAAEGEARSFLPWLREENSN